MIKIEIAINDGKYYDYDELLCDHCEKYIGKNLEYVEVLGDDCVLSIHKKCFKPVIKEMNAFIEEIKKKTLIKKIAGI